MKPASLAVFAALAVAAASTCAQQFPAKPVRMIIPFPPGGPTDIFGRMVANHLAEVWKVQVVADNRAGAGGNLGAELIAKAPADGYTIGMFTVAQSISPHVYSKLPFDPIKDFSHISLVATVPSVLMVHPALPAKTVRELLTIAKARPNELNYASTGNGTSPHMLMEMFLWMTGTRMSHVPYKGAAPALIDQVAGQVVVAFNSAVGALPYARSGKLRAIAVSTRERFPAMPELPTVDEGGVKGYDGSSWQGLAAPAGTPKEIVATISAEVAKLVKRPEMRERILNSLGGIPVGNTPDEFSRYLAADTAKWAKVAKAANVRLD